MMRASLVIKRSSYDQALQGLIAKNQTLETIVVGSLRLEPSRGKRSRAKYLEPFRRIVSSIYKALQLGLCGACPQKHGVNLALLAPRLSLRGDEESIIGKLDFRVILSHHDARRPENQHPQIWNWKEVKLQVDVPSRILKRGAIIPSCPPIEATGERRVTKRVKISAEVNFPTINAQAISNGLPEAKSPMPLILAPPPKLMTDKLCQALSMDSFRSKTCGYVTDPSVLDYGRFTVLHIDDIRDSCELTFISIRDMMKTPVHWGQRSMPSLPQKLSLASSIASGILQLHNTPWLSIIITAQTLYLSKFDDIVSFNRVYISKKAPENACYHESPCPCGDSTSVISRSEGFGNEFMWALFVLLIEVVLWRAMDDILSENSITNSAGASPKEKFDYTTERGFGIVRSLLSKVAMVGGQEYCSAVESCLKLAFGYPNLDLGHEELRHQIYGNIITPIEESYESSKTLTITGGGYDLVY